MNINKLSETLTAANGSGGLEKPNGPDSAKRSQEANGKPEATAMNAEETREVVKRANASMAESGSDLKFRMDEENGKPIVQIIDRQTEKVIRQIPSVEMLELSKALAKMQGVLVSKIA